MVKEYFSSANDYMIRGPCGSMAKEKRNFSDWLGNFVNTLAGYDYYTDFKKAYENVEDIKVRLSILNSLIGSKSIRSEFETLVKKYPEVLECIPLLLAVRDNEIKILGEGGELFFNFKKPKYSSEQYAVFMEKSGLFDLMSKHIICNLIDYALGVEVGLDSNARKNRTGKLMEDRVESYLKKANVEYYKEMKVSKIKKKWGLDLSGISKEDKAEKKFDFVVKTASQIYGIEVNFYSSQGSKLNETARSYKMLNKESEAVKGFTFIWITDGKGWNSARSNLKETFDTMEHIYCIRELDDGIFDRIF